MSSVCIVTVLRFKKREPISRTCKLWLNFKTWPRKISCKFFLYYTHYYIAEVSMKTIHYVSGLEYWWNFGVECWKCGVLLKYFVPTFTATQTIADLEKRKLDMLFPLQCVDIYLTVGSTKIHDINATITPFSYLFHDLHESKQYMFPSSTFTNRQCV